MIKSNNKGTRKMERNVTYIALFAAFVAVLGLLPKFTLASGVPITAQSLGIMLAGVILGSWRGALAMLLFLALVAIGLPLLAGGRGGLGVFASPTVGFLIGFPFAAFCAGLVMERVKILPILPRAFIASIVGGIIVLYAFGIPGMAVMLDKSLFDAALLATPFLPGDMIKVTVAAVAAQALYRARPGMVLSTS